MADNPTQQAPVDETPSQLVSAPEETQEGEEPLVEEPVSDDALMPEEIEELRANEVAFSWQASEYVHHHKGKTWYLSLGGGLLVLVIISAWLKLWMSTVTFIAMGVAIAVYASKPPRTLLYELTPTGISIEGKVYSFKELRSFGVLIGEEWHTIDLEPAKRFMPHLSVLFEDEDFEEIVGHLELHLPRIDRKPDMIERVARQLRF